MTGPKLLSLRVAALVHRLEELRPLEKDWDSYGAEAPEPGSIDRAIVFAKAFLDGQLHVTCTNRGTICFECASGSTIEVGGQNGSDEIWIDD